MHFYFLTSIRIILPMFLKKLLTQIRQVMHFLRMCTISYPFPLRRSLWFAHSLCLPCLKGGGFAKQTRRDWLCNQKYFKSQVFTNNPSVIFLRKRQLPLHKGAPDLCQPKPSLPKGGWHGVCRDGRIVRKYVNLVGNGS